MPNSSTELTIPSSQLLCEEIIRRHGTDRGNGQRIRLDADLTGRDIDGTEYTMRLIQQQGIGRQALYTLRAQTPLSNIRSIYRYDVATAEVSHRVGQSTSTAWPPQVLLPLLYSVLESSTE